MIYLRFVIYESLRNIYLIMTKITEKPISLKVGDLMSVIRKHLKRFLRCKQKRNICPEILYCRKAIDMVSELQ